VVSADGLSERATEESVVTEDSIRERLIASEGVVAKRLRLLDVVRIDNRGAKVHPLFDAVWRRYLYLIPLDTVAPGGEVRVSAQAPSAGNFSLDVQLMDSALRQLEGHRRCYRHFAYLPTAGSSPAVSDSVPSGRRNKRKKDAIDSDFDCILYRARAFQVSLPSSERDGEAGAGSSAVCVELVGDRFLRRMVRIIVVSLHGVNPSVCHCFRCMF